MIFINAGALIAVAAAVIPILIHLFSRQRHREVEFSTLKFLKKLENKRLRRLKIAELILLLLRVLAVACIALAFARPAIRHLGGGDNPGANVCAVILLDNSLPTLARSPEGSLFASARNTAVELLSVFNPGDEINLLTTSFTGEQFRIEPTENNAEKLRKKLFELNSLDAGPDWETSFSNIIQTFRESDLPNRELYVISPFYHKFSEPENELLNQIKAENVRIFYTETGPDYQKNTAITRLQLKTEIVQPGIPVIAGLEIANYSNESLENIPISLFVGDERVASTSFSAAPGEEVKLELKFVPEKPGFITGSARLDNEDALFTDNRSYFTLYIPLVLQVFLIGDSLETSIVKLALNPFKDAENSLKIVELPSISRLVDYPQAKVIFLTGIDKITSYSAGLLRSILVRGGGIILSPSQISAVSDINRNFLKPLNLPQFSEIDSDVSSWGNIDFAHPIFDGVFSEKIELEPPLFKRYFKLTGNIENAVISFRGGNPFIAESHPEEGRILIFASGFSEWWSDIAFRGIFVPLMNRAAQYVGSNISNRFKTVTAGDVIEHFEDPVNSVFTIKRPDGLTIEAIPEPGLNSVKLKFADTGLSGIYVIKVDGDTSAVYAVNPDVEYSKLHRDDSPPIAGALKLDAKTDIMKAVYSARIGTELWKIFLIVGLSLLIIEQVITRLVK
ncbi:BatA domain-containing protein [bacterium]|nr:BatA domain-containing protein [bacterium]